MLILRQYQIGVSPSVLLASTLRQSQDCVIWGLLDDVSITYANILCYRRHKKSLKIPKG